MQHAHPLLRLILSTLSLIEASASPAATIRMQRSSNTTTEDGTDGKISKMPYGSDLPGVSDINHVVVNHLDEKTHVGIEPSLLSASGISYECATLLCLLITAGNITANDTINTSCEDISTSALLIDEATKRALRSLQRSDAHTVWQAKRNVMGK